MQIEKIFVGGWFQRTTLHLSEIYDFLVEVDSPLDLDKRKLRKLHKALALKDVKLLVDDLEHIRMSDTTGIVVKIFEDGLIVLNKDFGKDLKADINELTSYYETKLSPALSYLFSLGAKIPKELASIKTIYPYFVVLNKESQKTIEELLADFQQEKHFEVKQSTFEVFRGDKLYIINNISEKLQNVEKFIQEQIFMREFKGQLHRYLNLHRIIWEKIADVKEKGEIKGSEVGAFNTKIESYAKTINLIDTRINQMGAYISTRKSVVKSDTEMANLAEVLQFKHETLSDTLSYVKDIWKMTRNYVNSALKLFSAIQAKSTEKSVKNLTVITSMGVGATLMGLFSKSAPTFTWFGVGYFFVLALIGYGANKIMRTTQMRRMYKIQDVEAAQDIK